MFNIVPLKPHRLTYRQTDTLNVNTILILSHGKCSMLVKMQVIHFVSLQIVQVLSAKLRERGLTGQEFVMAVMRGLVQRIT